MYQVFDHTADIGIRVEGPTIEELFAESGRALFDLLIRSRRSSLPSIDVPILLKAADLDQLFVRWLQELLFIFEQRRLVLTNFWIDRMSDTALSGAAKGTVFDPSRHHQKLAIKAVTYHQLKVGKGPDGLWHAQVIFDV